MTRPSRRLSLANCATQARIPFSIDVLRDETSSRPHNGAIKFPREVYAAHVRVYEVQQILGRSNPKVTRRYSHLSTATLQEAASSVADLINEAMKKSA